MAINFTGMTFGGMTLSGPPSADAQFNYVSALFSGEGTNGAQNNTFIDSSSNAFTITRNGTPTQGSFSPYGSNWSNYFNGTPDYFTTPANAALSMGSGDFTWEMWIYPTTAPSGLGTSSNQFLFGYRNGNDTSPWLSLNSGSGGVNPIILFSGDTTNFLSGTFPTLNQWSHIAITRSGTALKMFLNGAVVGSTTNSTNFSDASTRYIGAINNSSPPVIYYFPGYISNLRIVKGTAVYTAAFTPPTAPLTAIANTSLLTCQSSRFVDNSTNAFAITAGGSPSAQRYNPFGTATTYSTSVIGGSGYYNGTTDYLSTPVNLGFDFGTGDFTVELWANYASTTQQRFSSFISYGGFTNSGPNRAGWSICLDTTNNLIYVTIATTGYGWTFNPTAYASNWFYLAVVRNAGSLQVYVNGTALGAAQSATGSASHDGNNYPLYIGQGTNLGSNQYFSGYMDDLRITKGTAVYTTSFTPPTAPLGTISGTSLLLNYINAGIYDSAMMNNAITVGAAQISTAQYKFGSSSISFNGTTSYLSNLNNSLNYAFGSGDFTIEFWLYASTLPTNPASAQLFDTRPASTNGAYPLIYLYYDGTIRLYVSSADRITSSTISTSTWYHVAVCRSSGSTKLFINGTQSGSTYTDATVYLAGNALIGASYSGNPTISNFLNGYLDDIRVTKGYARYTANFTAPTEAFPTLGP